ncbi:MAG: cation diffusion facilitator family transporter [Bryobacteraceae bacterium]
MGESRTAIYAALAGSVAVASTKLIVALFTGSSAMFSEGLHSTVDGANEVLLLLGQKLSARPADESHPFGHGQELYFWTLIVSLTIFTAGGAVSVYEGVLRLLHPAPPIESIWNYVVLGAAAVFEGGSFAVGIKQFRKEYPNANLLAALRTSKDPTIFTVMFEDITDVAGLAVAFAGILLSSYFKTSLFDGAASVAIGAMLMIVAVLLVRESKGLLTGEAAGPKTREGIRAILETDPDVERANPPLTMYFGPETILLAVEIQFRSGLTSGGVTEAVDRLETAVRAQYPKVKRIFIEAESIRSGAGKA